MSKRSTSELQAPEKGHNYDAVQRAEFIRAYYDERADIEHDKAVANEKFKLRIKKNTAKLKGLGIDVGHAEEGYEDFLRNQQIENADSTQERAKLEAKHALAQANNLECRAAANNVSQLDFHATMEAGKKARETLEETADDAETEEADSSKKKRVN